MVKFKTTNKGRFNQEFGSTPEQYSSMGILGHSGIDTQKGWDMPIATDNAGYVYKVVYAVESPSNWQAVYILVPDGDDFVEICYGHLLKVFVKEGDTVIEGQYIGSEGNRGYVFQGGVQITPEMQRNGDKRGEHLHTSYRPVQRILGRVEGSFYLDTAKGKTYKDKEGYQYRIKYQDNGYKGCVDPRLYTYKNTVWEDLIMFAKVITTLKI